MTRSKPLSLGIPKNDSPISSTFTSPTDGGSNLSSPNGAVMNYPADSLSRPRPGSKEKSMASSSYLRDDELASPEITSLPPFPAPPQATPKHSHEASRSFFSNLKASKSSNKVHATSEMTIRQVSEELSRSKIDLMEGSVYSRPSPGSTPDLSLSNFDTGSAEWQGRPYSPAILPYCSYDADVGVAHSYQSSDHPIPRRFAASPLPSDDSSAKVPSESSYTKKPKPRFANLITRTRSVRTDDIDKGTGRTAHRTGGRKSKPSTPIVTTHAPQIHLNYDESEAAHDSAQAPAPLTAPLSRDRFPRGEGSPGPRNRSADRGRETGSAQQNTRHPGPHAGNSGSGVFKDGAGSHLFNNIRNTSSRAAGGLNKAGKGIMAKMNRSSSTNNQKEEERYVCQVINLPLIEQTRLTRLADRLENSKDRTEFWMPALPWRCIDYLNYRGCEEEGLYRVPGSDREIRQWQKRFDQEYDINLFDEPDLYDINVVGSLFKSWLRELPTDIFPKAIQTKIYQAHPNATEVPQLLKDELSMLPPWNYYLLFAITCHLSLLTVYSDKNRMTYSNLVICFQPCLRIDAFCFQFLVQKWRDCWQGCWTETAALEEEYKHIDAMGNGEVVPGSSSGSSDRSAVASGTAATSAVVPADDHSANSSHNAYPSRGRPPALVLATGEDVAENPPHIDHNGKTQNGHARSPSQLPELVPMQPLSPIGF